MNLDIPKTLPDCRGVAEIAEDRRRADKYAAKGSVQHFALRLGFMPGNEEQAEGIIGRLIREREYLEDFIESHRCALDHSALGD
jgi:hypothetical protein